MVRSTKDFVAIVNLAEGEHEYKFLVDGNWKNDENNPDLSQKDGFKNNLIRVQKADFNAFKVKFDYIINHHFYLESLQD